MRAKRVCSDREAGNATCYGAQQIVVAFKSLVLDGIGGAAVMQAILRGDAPAN
jgi:hypothetical protein